MLGFRHFAAVVCAIAIASMGDIGAANARPRFGLATSLGLGTGYDSNTFLDAAALPTAGGLGGGLAHLQADLAAAWYPTATQRLTLLYDGAFDQFFAGGVEPESVLRHAAELSYALPPLAGFRLTLGGMLAQLWYRLDDGGWLGVGGVVRLTRAVGSQLRLEAAYLPLYTRYTIPPVSHEIGHQLDARAIWSFASGWMLEPGFRFTVGLTEPARFNTLRYQGDLQLVWSPGALPLSIQAGYAFAALDFVTHGDRLDLVHQLHAELTVELTSWCSLFARYEGVIGNSNVPSVGRYARHFAIAGTSFSLEGSWPHRAPTASRLGAPIAKPGAEPRRSVLHLSLRAPHASRVSLVGTFNDWDPAADPLVRKDGRWTLDRELPPGDHRYMLWIDGRIAPPPGCETWVADGFGGRSCAVAVPGRPAEPTAPDSEPSSRPDGQPSP